MIGYVLRRIINMIPTLILISIIGFTVITLPPGDYLTVKIAELEQRGSQSARDQVESLTRRYSLDQPVYVQYFKWVSGFIRGDFGRSFEYEQPVSEIIKERLGLTFLVAFSILLLTWALSIPIGIFSATHQYTIWDHIVSFIGFIGLSLPNFLLALILLVLGFKLTGEAPLGLFSREMAREPWGFAKFVDLLKHLWVPMIVVATARTAELIRIMRGNLLDVLGQQYIQTARAKGLSEMVVIYKHAVRVAINPLISMLGMQLPIIISGTAITAIVLSLPTAGPIFYESLKNQDMYLSGTILLFLSLLLVVGNLISDILLAWVDPRIKYE